METVQSVTSSEMWTWQSVEPMSHLWPSSSRALGNMTSQARLSERLAAIFTENRDAEIGQTKGGEEEA